MTNALAKREQLSPLVTIGLPALAGWLGWGIRGQIGHERGAMIPGSMVGLSLAVISSDPEVHRRAGLLGATGAMGMSFGGTETYGQTLGLSQGPTRDETYWWGILGVAVKGGVWWGLAGTYLGMALSDKEYTPFELMWLTAQSTALWRMGVELLNQPHEPPERLPRIYFSGRSERSAPRPEVWGGQWCALLGLLSYALVRRDRTVLTMGGYGILAGAAGFAGGQALQAWGTQLEDAPELVRQFGWWKVMETTFGLIGGAVMGAGMMAARPADRPLPPRREPPVAERLLAIAAADYALGSHLLDREWTVHAMDSMVIGGLALAEAFACNLSAWLYALPLVHTYTLKDTVEYWRAETAMQDVVAPYVADSMRWIGGLAGLAAALVALQATGGRAAAGLGLVAAAWGQSLLSHNKMLLPALREAAGPEAPVLPLREHFKEAVAAAGERRPGQLVVETAFAIAAVALTGLVAYALGKRDLRGRDLS